MRGRTAKTGHVITRTTKELENAIRRVYINQVTLQVSSYNRFPVFSVTFEVFVIHRLFTHGYRFVRHCVGLHRSPPVIKSVLCVMVVYMLASEYLSKNVDSKYSLCVNMIITLAYFQIDIHRRSELTCNKTNSLNVATPFVL